MTVDINIDEILNPQQPLLKTSQHRMRERFLHRISVLELMVVSFGVHDDVDSEGVHVRKYRWKLVYDRTAPPVDLEICLHGSALQKEVSVSTDGGVPILLRAEMKEDFNYDWLLQAHVQGIGEFNYFECNFLDDWVPATITWQKDGVFEVVAQVQDEFGSIEDHQLDRVGMHDLREASTKNQLFVDESNLMLHIPKDKPADASLHVNGDECVTHRFGRPSPPSSQTKASISLQLTRDRSFITANVGEEVLQHFVSGFVRAEKSSILSSESSWTFQLGPLARHTVTISKHRTIAGLLDLQVDGETFIHARAPDIGCKDGIWQCTFRFLGERILDFEVFKTTSHGIPLDETDHVEERRKYVHECSVVAADDSDLSIAQLKIDGIDFKNLPLISQFSREPNAAMPAQKMLEAYSIQAPYKVDPRANAASVLVFPSIAQLPERRSRGVFGDNPFFGNCCSPQIEPDTIFFSEHVAMGSFAGPTLLS